MPKNSGSFGIPWKTCDRCGFDYPMHQIRKQRGLFVCTVIPCVDDLSYEQASRRISEKLNPPGEGEDKFQFMPDEEFDV